MGGYNHYPHPQEVGYNHYPQQYVAAPVAKLRQKEKEEKQDFSKIPGVPGVDYPLYHSVPHTSFSCHNVPAHPGMYANVETGCQVRILIFLAA